MVSCAAKCWQIKAIKEIVFKKTFSEIKTDWKVRDEVWLAPYNERDCQKKKNKRQ